MITLGKYDCETCQQYFYSTAEYTKVTKQNVYSKQKLNFKLIQNLQTNFCYIIRRSENNTEVNWKFCDKIYELFNTTRW